MQELTCAVRSGESLVCVGGGVGRRTRPIVWGLNQRGKDFVCGLELREP